MHVALVTKDHEPETVTALIEYMDSVQKEVTRFYTVDTDPCRQIISIEAGSYGVPLTMLISDVAFHGTAAASKRNVKLAEEVDKVVAFWDYREPDVSSIITTARLWGKKVHVNPHDNGGIISPRTPDTVDKFSKARGATEDAGVSKSPDEGSTPSEPTT